MTRRDGSSFAGIVSDEYVKLLLSLPEEIRFQVVCEDIDALREASTRLSRVAQGMETEPPDMARVAIAEYQAKVRELHARRTGSNGGR